MGLALAGTIGFAALAGVLSILSPCVLPLVPLVFGAAASEHRLGPVALAAGLVFSFTGVGLFVATIGFAVGLDAGVFRSAGAVLLLGIGAVLLVPSFQARFVLAAGTVGSWAGEQSSAISAFGLSGQFGIGLLLGAVWSPCVGPTLGAASVMAARGENLGQVSLTMFAFGLGVALPLLILGHLSRESLLHWRSRMMSAGKGAKQIMGSVLVGIGVLILSGLDRSIETGLVTASPDWLTKLTTRF